MKNVYILCEGQTEESFVNNVLAPYFMGMQIYLYPVILTTKRTASAKYTGGVSDYSKILNGTLVSQRIGIECILRECKHFSQWVEQIRCW